MNIDYLVVPLAKSAWPEGRLGYLEDQDWYCALRYAIRLYTTAKYDNNLVVRLLTASGFQHADSSLPEIEQYRIVLEKYAFTEGEDYILLREGIDTFTQLDAIFKYAKENHVKEIHLVSTRLHYLRIRWICWRDGRKNVMHHTPKGFGGIPRLSEIKNDIILTILMPIIDILGKRAKFQAYVASRRAKGKL